MIDATLNLSKIHCNEESDFFGAEPYLWTLFFYTDIITIPGSDGVVVTHTPHQTSTTRGMYPNGIEEGDEIVVPTTMGEFDVTLDSGNSGVSLLGCLFALIDERNTDADAIKAGHVAFGTSAHVALNELVATKILAEDKAPTADEIKAMSTFIANAVETAIRNKLSWWDYLDQQDRFVGSGFKVFTDEQIVELAEGGGGVDQFEVKIRSERIVPASPGFPPAPNPPQLPGTTTLIDDYDVIGTLRVRQADPVPERPDPEKDRLVEAVKAAQAVQARIAGLERDIHAAKGAKRQDLLAQLRHARKFTLKKAIRALSEAGKACAAPESRLCIADDCCEEHAHQVYLNCMATTGFGHEYCRALQDYRFQLCRNPDAPRPLARPTTPAARD